MNNLKKGLSLFLAALFVMVSALVAMPVKAAEAANVDLPEINLAVVEHNPVYVGETQAFYVTSNYQGEVQYRAWLKQDDGSWVALTDGYSEPVDAQTPYKITSNVQYKEGDNVVVLWVKRAGVAAAHSKTHPTFGQVEWDSYYIVNMAKCTAFDADKNIKGADINIAVDGTKVTVSGNYAYRINAKNLETGKYEEIVTNYTEGSAERTLPAGKYIIYAHAIKALDASKEYTTADYDAWKLAVVELQEKANKEISAITTKLDKGMFGGDVTVALTEDGKAAFPTVKYYSVYADVNGKSMQLAAPTLMGEKVMMFPAEEDMDITVKLLDANKEVVKAIDTKLGQDGKVTLTNEDNNDDTTVEYNAVATLVSGMFGGTVTVTSENEGVAKYRVLGNVNGKSMVLVNDTAIGTSAMMFPAEEGQAVTVELLDANGNVLGSVDTTLVVAK